MATKKTVKASVAKNIKVTANKASIKSPPKKAKATATKPDRTSARRKSAVTKMVMSLAAGLSDPTQGNLAKFDHLVVLMLENRSFDHMLGYLSLTGGRNDIDGLTAGMSNPDNHNVPLPVFHLDRTRFTKDEDPCHEGHCVTDQLKNNNSGFLKNYLSERPGTPVPPVVMGHYDANDLPVFDHLAKEFTVCDRWFCSVDGATWPNRLYSITGRADKNDFKKENKKVPLYDNPSFVRHLDSNGVSWRWYCQNFPPTLRLVDGNYRFGSFSHFASIDSTFSIDSSFLDDARKGNLADVSWIDPGFVNSPLGSADTSNDDHPPSDVRNGQELVLRVYDAVVNGPKWERTLLLVTYDEHGGFFDHVPVPAANDDRPTFQSYGVRVPAFIISPFVEKMSVSHTLFDHTSIIKTILMKYCSDGASIPDMGKRVTSANHLGSVLTRDTPRTPPVYTKAKNAIIAWKTEAFKASLNVGAAVVVPPTEPNDLQKGMIAARKRLKAEGFPEGQL